MVALTFSKVSSEKRKPQTAQKFSLIFSLTTISRDNTRYYGRLKKSLIFNGLADSASLEKT